jgi:hypothetical protein
MFCRCHTEKGLFPGCGTDTAFRHAAATKLGLRIRCFEANDTLFGGVRERWLPVWKATGDVSEAHSM